MCVGVCVGRARAGMCGGVCVGLMGRVGCVFRFLVIVFAAVDMCDID